MNRTSILATAALGLAFAASAQVQSGKVIYEETMKMNVKLDGDAAQYAHLFPKEQKMQHVLYFTQDAAIFQPAEQKQAKQEEATETEGGMRMNIRMDMPQDKIYTGFKNGKSIEQRDFMGRKFLVSGDLAKQPWKMTGNQKTILDYPCQEAVMIKDKDTTTAWFTTAIPVSAGPHGWTGLPGLILEATRNSNLSITATSVMPGPVDDGVIVQPKGGKKVSREEFKAIVDAKMKELGDQGEGGNHVIIRVREH
jgi:GLPGLI family protein